jgi:hypothetical protein
VQFLIDKVSDSLMCRGEEEKINHIFLGIQRILRHLTHNDEESKEKS